VTDIAMPATPYRIWQTIQDAKGRAAQATRTPLAPPSP
jgi:hypothetical protein